MGTAGRPRENDDRLCTERGVRRVTDMDEHGKGRQVLQIFLSKFRGSIVLFIDSERVVSHGPCPRMVVRGEGTFRGLEDKQQLENNYLP